MDTSLRAGYAPPVAVPENTSPLPEVPPAARTKSGRSVTLLPASERPLSLSSALPEAQPPRHASEAPDSKAFTTSSGRRVTVKAEIDKDYLAFRKAARAGYNEALPALNGVIGKYSATDAPSIARLKQLQADFESFCNLYLNPDSPKAVLMPPQLVAQCARDQVALTDFIRERVGLKGAEREMAILLQSQVANSLQAVRAYITDQLSEATIRADHKALQDSPYRGSPGLRGILEDGRQIKQFDVPPENLDRSKLEMVASNGPCGARRRSDEEIQVQRRADRLCAATS